MKSLNKWQQLNLRNGSGSSASSTGITPYTTAAFTITAPVMEYTIAYPSDWVSVLPEVHVYKDGICVNPNSWTAHVEADHARIVFRTAGDYLVKLVA